MADVIEANKRDPEPGSNKVLALGRLEKWKC